MIGASEPLEIAKLCEGWRAGGCLSFYPLSQETPFLLPDLRGILR